MFAYLWVRQMKPTCVHSSIPFLQFYLLFILYCYFILFCWCFPMVTLKLPLILILHALLSRFRSHKVSNNLRWFNTVLPILGFHIVSPKSFRNLVTIKHYVLSGSLYNNTVRAIRIFITKAQREILLIFGFLYLFGDEI